MFWFFLEVEAVLIALLFSLLCSLRRFFKGLGHPPSPTMSIPSESVRERKGIRAEDATKSDTTAATIGLTASPYVTGAKTLMFYTFLLIAVPVIAYYVGKGYVLEDLLGYSKQQSFIYWAILSVIGIHGVLGLMIVKAFREEVVIPARVPTKQD